MGRDVDCSRDRSRKHKAARRIVVHQPKTFSALLKIMKLEHDGIRLREKGEERRMPKAATVTIERGVAFFDDGTEVSNVSVSLVKAAPDMLRALKTLLTAAEIVDGQEPPDADDVEHLLEACREARKAVKAGEGDTT